MSHSHNHSHPASGRRLFITMMLNFAITITEIVGGIWSGSLSLISDALHNFSDGIAVIISYLAIRLMRRPKNPQYTFGLRRAEILAAIINASTLIIICFYLFKEAYERFVHPQPIAGGMMITVATIGLAANIAGTLLIRSGTKHSMNLRSVYLHLLSDAVSSAAVILGGLAIYLYNVYWLDPLLTVLISLYILRESYLIAREAVQVIMMASPQHLQLEQIEQTILSIPGVKNVHHVHLWQLDEKSIHFEAHVEVEDMLISATTTILNTIQQQLRERFGITHVTIQFEGDRCPEKTLL